MSPEQAEGKDVDQRSDIYSFGVILYEMVTGKVPFEGDTPFTIGVKHKSEIPKDPKELNAQIPDELNSVILKCLEKAKEDRHQTAEELLAFVTDIERGFPTTEKVPSEKKSETKRTYEIKRKNLFLYGAAALVLILAVVVGLFWISGRGESIDSIAVLPFANIDKNPDIEYICDGMTTDIIKISSTYPLSRDKKFLFAIDA